MISGVLHIIGICGIGMSGIAQALKNQGYTVQGSDADPGDTAHLLARAGIRVVHGLSYIGDADFIIYSNAVPEDHPELQYARLLGKPLLRRWEILKFLLQDKEVIVVSGCHGKTTTTAMIGEILTDAGKDPTIICGGVMQRFGNNVRLGKSSLYVVEGDESDDTFSLLPRDFAVVTNIGDDHMEYHQDVWNLEKKFLRFISNTKAIIPNLKCFFSVEGFRYDYDLESNASRIAMVEPEGLKMRFRYKLDEYHDFLLNALGLFNVKNAMAAIACTYSCGVGVEVIKDSLENYGGVFRRMTFIGELLGSKVFTDYAHHPDEILSTADALSHMGKLILVVQPHRYSRVAKFFERYSSLWRKVNALIFLDIYPAGEKPNGYDSEQLCCSAREQGATKVFHAKNDKETYDRIVEINTKGAIIVFMGAGDVNKLACRIVDSFEVLK
ncbi:UDP-N-acetylmuramate--alanine ligase [Neorickettsia helminthoeca str. Oregon]|uniref:UDP-N-acetylmuramate--L-alanine ligase n=1 Tax=Neorickettsia helminthoeca str. Oregon TaxID=1286528 RepID=X5H4P8_9RICK|nr:UDP-N-acetylmuramate--L-alanine ligase [Neorickettsia helminthoeca]AHX11683.1 UDP-N-acetylmuramate--alanine ligase [Neorickettsia helminthoeca str. Oregon]